MPYKDIKPLDIFKCRQCGECCKGYGGTFVTENEIEAIAGISIIRVLLIITARCLEENRSWHRARMHIVYSGTNYARFIRSNPACAKIGLL